MKSTVPTSLALSAAILSAQAEELGNSKNPAPAEAIAAQTAEAISKRVIPSTVYDFQDLSVPLNALALNPGEPAQIYLTGFGSVLPGGVDGVVDPATGQKLCNVTINNQPLAGFLAAVKANRGRWPSQVSARLMQVPGVDLSGMTFTATVANGLSAPNLITKTFPAGNALLSLTTPTGGGVVEIKLNVTRNPQPATQAVQQ